MSGPSTVEPLNVQPEGVAMVVSNPSEVATVATTTSPTLIEAGNAMLSDDKAESPVVAEVGSPRLVTVSASVTVLSTMRWTALQPSTQNSLPKCPT